MLLNAFYTSQQDAWSSSWSSQPQSAPRNWDNPAAAAYSGRGRSFSANWGSSNNSWTNGQTLSEEPSEVLLVNSESSGAYRSLISDIYEADLVGFDAEWVPDFKWGSDNPISVLQLAFPYSGRVFVLQLGRLLRLPQEVQMMLVNPGVTKVGFACDQNDIAKLSRSGIAITKGSVVDIRAWCASALQLNEETLGLKRAANDLLGFDLKKSKRCTCSDWSSMFLTPEQIHYAALDAWVALRLYYATC
jgi:hypothetical protein